eukprot:TRINITY_DN29942_c0_g1_i1.p1 TRINITY_DN29942_c0_g1~~TRINITY_DN29942_c0_g1_i1.p1  ORF type:complete len:838 (+),score=218.39 TRINITY_DN29942_c0_g1_i1:156-2669(+)
MAMADAGRAFEVIHHDSFRRPSRASFSAASSSSSSSARLAAPVARSRDNAGASARRHSRRPDHVLAADLEAAGTALSLFGRCSLDETHCACPSAMRKVLRRHFGLLMQDLSCALRGPLRVILCTPQPSVLPSGGGPRVDFVTFWRGVARLLGESDASGRQKSRFTIHGLQRFADGILGIVADSASGGPETDVLVTGRQLKKLLAEIRDDAEDPDYWAEVLAAVPRSKSAGLPLASIGEAVHTWLSDLVQTEDEAADAQPAAFWEEAASSSSGATELQVRARSSSPAAHSASSSSSSRPAAVVSREATVSPECHAAAERALAAHFSGRLASPEHERHAASPAPAREQRRALAAAAAELRLRRASLPHGGDTAAASAAATAEPTSASISPTAAAAPAADDGSTGAAAASSAVDRRSPSASSDAAASAAPAREASPGEATLGDVAQANRGDAYRLATSFLLLPDGGQQEHDESSGLGAEGQEASVSRMEAATSSDGVSSHVSGGGAEEALAAEPVLAERDPSLPAAPAGDGDRQEEEETRRSFDERSMLWDGASDGSSVFVGFAGDNHSGRAAELSDGDSEVTEIYGMPRDLEESYRPDDTELILRDLQQAYLEQAEGGFRRSDSEESVLLFRRRRRSSRGSESLGSGGSVEAEPLAMDYEQEAMDTDLHVMRAKALALRLERHMDIGNPVMHESVRQLDEVHDALAQALALRDKRIGELTEGVDVLRQLQQDAERDKRLCQRRLKRLEEELEGLRQQAEQLPGRAPHPAAQAQAPAAPVSPPLGTEGMCVVCLQAAADFAAVPCGHLALCGGCVQDHSMTSRCVICRGYCQTFMRIYRP